MIKKIQREEALLHEQLCTLDRKMDGYVKSGKCLRENEKQVLIDSFQIVLNGSMHTFEMRLLNRDALKKSGVLGSDVTLTTHRDESIQRMRKLIQH